MPRGMMRRLTPSIKRSPALRPANMIVKKTAAHALCSPAGQIIQFGAQAMIGRTCAAAAAGIKVNKPEAHDVCFP